MMPVAMGLHQRHIVDVCVGEIARGVSAWQEIVHTGAVSGCGAGQ
jgi:hypothetical protein